MRANHPLVTSARSRATRKQPVTHLIDTARGRESTFRVWTICGESAGVRTAVSDREKATCKLCALIDALEAGVRAVDRVPYPQRMDPQHVDLDVWEIAIARRALRLAGRHQ